MPITAAFRSRIKKDTVQKYITNTSEIFKVKLKNHQSIKPYQQQLKKNIFKNHRQPLFHRPLISSNNFSQTNTNQ